MRYLMAASLLLMSMCAYALGHGAAQWIQDGRYKNAVGDLCCGERDCSELADGDVSVTPGGFLIKSLNGSHPMLSGCLRVTVGTPQENDRFVESLRASL